MQVSCLVKSFSCCTLLGGMMLHTVIKQAASHLKRQRYLRIIIPGKTGQERKSKLKWMTESKSNMG